MTDEELDAFEDAMELQAEELRRSLAEDLGGDPEEFETRREPVPDGADAEGG